MISRDLFPLLTFHCQSDCCCAPSKPVTVTKYTATATVTRTALRPRAYVEPQVEQAEQAETSEHLESRQVRHLCPVCPAGAPVLGVSLSPKARNSEFCCPARKTTTRSMKKTVTITRNFVRFFVEFCYTLISDDGLIPLLRLQIKASPSVKVRVFCDANRNRAFDSSDSPLRDRNYYISQPNTASACSSPLGQAETNNNGVLTAYIKGQEPGTLLWVVDPNQCSAPLIAFKTDSTGGMKSLDLPLPVPAKPIVDQPVSVSSSGMITVNGRGGTPGNVVLLLCGKDIIGNDMVSSSGTFNINAPSSLVTGCQMVVRQQALNGCQSQSALVGLRPPPATTTPKMQKTSTATRVTTSKSKTAAQTTSGPASTTKAAVVTTAAPVPTSSATETKSVTVTQTTAAESTTIEPTTVGSILSAGWPIR